MLNDGRRLTVVVQVVPLLDPLLVVDGTTAIKIHRHGLFSCVSFLILDSIRNDVIFTRQRFSPVVDVAHF